MIPVSLTFPLLPDGRKQATKYRRAGAGDRCIAYWFLLHSFAGLLVADCQLPTVVNPPERQSKKASTCLRGGTSWTRTNRYQSHRMYILTHFRTGAMICIQPHRLRCRFFLIDFLVEASRVGKAPKPSFLTANRRSGGGTRRTTHERWKVVGRGNCESRLYALTRK